MCSAPTTTSTPDAERVARAAERLVAAISHDDNHGGLLVRETIRAADELRIAVLRYRKKWRDPWER